MFRVIGVAVIFGVGSARIGAEQSEEPCSKRTVNHGIPRSSELASLGQWPSDVISTGRQADCVSYSDTRRERVSRYRVDQPFDPLE